MSLEDMAKKLVKPEISKDVAKPIMRSSVRTTAADLLTDLAKTHGFNESDECCEFKGSVDNQSVVINAIADKYGMEEAGKYKPTINVKPKTKWLQEGFKIRSGEVPLCFIHTFRDKVLWTVPMWHEKQMELSV